MYCPKCGQKLNADGSFCAFCGKNVAYLNDQQAAATALEGLESAPVDKQSKLTMQKKYYCNFCGTGVFSKDNFCYQCGKRAQKSYYNQGRQRKWLIACACLTVFCLSALFVFRYNH
jgi:hypothetical protein